ncbi:MAG TPA: DUF3140 domain-containing protein [Sphingomonas sp.]|nr:DUF3140 domain-containing protein [Sphingomonas sp.]
MPTRTDAKNAETYAAFKQAVNMTPAAIEKFLDSKDSKKVGWKGTDGEGSGESVGHASGRRIVAIKRKKKAELTDDDYQHMAKVVGYVKRHMAQGPEHRADIKNSKWRYSLMNWGHDPLKHSAK